MSDGIVIITNNVPRDIINPWELTTKERNEFLYLSWPDLDEGKDSASFMRYKGETYDLGDNEGIPHFAPGWDGYYSQSFFSGVLFRYPRDPDNLGRKDEIDSERVIIGQYYVK